MRGRERETTQLFLLFLTFDRRSAAFSVSRLLPAVRQNHTKSEHSFKERKKYSFLVLRDFLRIQKRRSTTRSRQTMWSVRGREGSPTLTKFVDFFVTTTTTATTTNNSNNR